MTDPTTPTEIRSWDWDDGPDWKQIRKNHGLPHGSESAIIDIWYEAAAPHKADADRLAEALREHTRHLNDENDDPLLEGHSIGCHIIQRPTDDNNHTTGSQHVGDCAANHRHLVEALRLHDKDHER